jgi:hypothetical protein
MNLTVNQDHKLTDIQQQFSEHFPFLKLLFFTPGANSGTKESQIKTNHHIAEFVQFGEPLIIEVGREETVREVEDRLSKALKTDVQIFRKSGESWLQTKHTDSWTLSAQNEEGEKISGFIDHKGEGERINPLDRDVFE